MAQEIVTAVNNPDLAPCRPRSPASGFVVPLNMVRVGECVKIKSVSGQDDTRRMLCNMGFVEDAEVTIITEMNGDVIVNIKGARVAISKKMASRVLTA